MAEQGVKSGSVVMWTEGTQIFHDFQGNFGLCAFTLSHFKKFEIFLCSIQWVGEQINFPHLLLDLSPGEGQKGADKGAERRKGIHENQDIGRKHEFSSLLSLIWNNNNNKDNYIYFFNFLTVLFFNSGVLYNTEI